MNAQAENVSSDHLLDIVNRAGQRAREASQIIANADSNCKNKALSAMAESILDQSEVLLEHNAIDLQRAREKQISAALLDRLELTPARISSMADGLNQVAGQADPVGTINDSKFQPSGLQIGKMCVPLGVIGIIYESRPNVTADASGLCIKSGNAALLRGGSEAIESNRAIARLIADGLESASLPRSCVQLIDTTDREAVRHLIQARDYVDVIIPRGGKSLVARIAEDAKVPVIKHLEGICHVYIDEYCGLEQAVEIAFNSKTYRYGICGSMETLLVSEKRAKEYLQIIGPRFQAHGVELRGCDRTREILTNIAPATEEDWLTEYLGPILAIKVVDTLQDAVEHIALYGSNHTDAIVTNDLQNSRHFVRAVDSSSVMVNAATCFADGYQYGLGAEIGISTDKLHVRGPVGVEGLTTWKYVVIGNGTIRS